MKKVLFSLLVFLVSVNVYSQNSIAIVSKLINQGTGNIDVTVEYSANQDGYIGMFLGTSAWAWLGDDSIAFEAGSGAFEVSITPDTPFEEGVTYNICADLFSVSPDTIIKETNDCQEVEIIEPAIAIVSKIINQGTGNIDVTVDYTANQDGYIGMFLGTSAWAWLGDDSIAFEAGSGTFEVSITPDTPFEEGVIYNICADLFSISPDTVIKVTNECQEVSIVSETSIKDVMVVERISIYPNPVTDFITLKANKEQEIIRHTIFSLKGEFVKNIITGKSEKIDVSELNAGFYFLRTYMKDGSIYIQEFIKK